LRARLSQPSNIPAGVRCAWHRLRISRGRTPIGTIVDEVGWSQRHFIERFRHELGVSPKAMARLLRFGSVVRTLKSRRTPVSLADLALSAGYYDQSHFNRDVREFAGTTPSALAASLLPDGGGFAA
jgi:transcriptional regulator GlxA family with amidase domain